MVQIAFTDKDGKVVGPLDIRENDGDTMEAGQKNMILVELLQELNGLAKIQFKHVSNIILKFSLLPNQETKARCRVRAKSRKSSQISWRRIFV